MPLLYLLYYHKVDGALQTFALCSQNDVLHDAYQFNGRIGPRPNIHRSGLRDLDMALRATFACFPNARYLQLARERS